MQQNIPRNKRALFLDRDGVINRQVAGDYVRNLSQLEILPGSIDAIVRLGSIFRYILVVTNQQGIGKGLMNMSDVEQIHQHIARKVHESGGRLDRIYCCPSLESDHDPNRKPGTGMGLQAKQEFPEIDFNQSLMIGDSLSDIQFAEKLGMPYIFITHGSTPPCHVKHVCGSLADVPDFVAKNGTFCI
jgi:histidinol-phosphate phosphatase family protein